MATTQQIAIKISADGKLAVAELKRVSDATGQVETKSKGLTAQLGSLRGLLGPLTAALGTAGLARGLVDAGQAAERLRMGLVAVTGSTAAAQREMDYIRDTASRLGLSVRDAGEAYLSLSAAAKGTALQGAASRQVFEAVTLAMGKLGKSSADTRGALLAVEQMISKGKVSAEELRGQLGERLPGAFQAAARAMGVTTAELGEMLQRGEVVAEQLLPELAAELNRLYDDGTRIGTLAAEWARFTNALTDLATEIYTYVGPALSWLLEQATAATQAVGRVFETIKRDTERTAQWFGALRQGDISFWEWLSGSDEAAARLEGSGMLTPRSVPLTIEINYDDVEPATRALTQFDRTVTRAAGGTKAAKKASDDLERSLQSLIRRYLPAVAAAQDYAEAERAVAAAVAASRLTQEQGLEILAAMRAEQSGLAEEGRTEVDAWAEVWKNGLQRIDDGFATLWENLFTGTKGTLESLKGMILKWLAEVAHALLTKRLVVGISAALTGTGAGTASAAGSAVSSGLGGLLNPTSLVSGFGSSLMTGLGSLGTALVGGAPAGLLGTIGNMASFGVAGLTSGTMAGFTAGAGLLGALALPVAGLAIPLISKVFGDKTEPRAYFQATANRGFEDDVFAASTGFGLNFGLAQKSHEVAAQDYAGAFAALAGVADALAATVGPAVTEAVRAEIAQMDDARLIGPKSFDATSGVQAILQQLLGTIAGTGDPLAQLVTERIGPLSGSIEEMIAQIAQAVAAIDGARGLRGALESLGLTLGATEEASLLAALHLADLAGGAQAMLEATAALDAVLVPEAERAERALAAMTEVLHEVGIALPDSRDALRQLVDGLDLTTEAGRLAYATVAQLAQGLDQHFAAVEQSADQLRQAEAALAEQRRDASERLEQLLLGEEAYAALQAERAQAELNRIALERLGLEQGIASLEVLRATIDRLGGVSEAVRLLGDEAVAFAQAATNAFGGLAESVAATTSASDRASAVQDEWWDRLTGGMREWLSEKYGSQLQAPLRELFAWSQKARRAVEEFAATSLLSVRAATEQVERLLRRGTDVNSLNALPGALDSLLAAAEREAPSRSAYELIARRIQGQAERLSLTGTADPAVYVRRGGGWNWDRVASNNSINTDLQLAQLRSLYEKTLRIFDRWDYDGLPATRT